MAKKKAVSWKHRKIIAELTDCIVDTAAGNSKAVSISEGMGKRV